MSGHDAEFLTESTDQGIRLDQFLVGHCPQFSRVQWRDAIVAGRVLVDGGRAKPAYRLDAGQKVQVDYPEAKSSVPEPEAIPLDLIFEDESIAVINKPAGMVVHPSKGHWSGTLTAALAHHFKQLSRVGGAIRPGIVHRLDRDTSGVIVVAKTDAVHLNLAEQFHDRHVAKEYLAIVSPPPDRDSDCIDRPIGAHPYQREKMAIRAGHTTSRPAETIFEVIERRGRFAWVKVKPKTGRTHQIRVHLAHIGCPIVADRLYSGRSELRQNEVGEPSNHAGDDNPILLSRQALHAHRLTIKHPVSAEELTFEAPLAEDLRTTVQAIFGRL